MAKTATPPTTPPAMAPALTPELRWDVLVVGIATPDENVFCASVAVVVASVAVDLGRGDPVDSGAPSM